MGLLALCIHPLPGLLIHHVVRAAISSVGSCACYGVSLLLGTDLAGAVWPNRLKHFQAEVEKRRHDLLSYIIFLRLTPILPNTFINVASPIVNVPLSSFAIGESPVFVGVSLQALMRCSKL